MNIVVVVGTRPEAIKLIPVYKQLIKKSGWKTKLVSTGQHQQMLEMIFDFFEVKPDVDLKVMTHNQDLGFLTSMLIQNCTQLLDTPTDAVIVQGDTTTAMAVSVAAFYKKVKVVHVEAGLRSYDKFEPFPEEINRRVISLVADFHFAPTAAAAQALRLERPEGMIFTVGNTVIDSLLWAGKKVALQKVHFQRLFSPFIRSGEKMVLITAHRRESFGNAFKEICSAIEVLSKRYPAISFVYPVHLNPKVREVVYSHLNGIPNVHLLDPVPYDQMVFLMTQSFLILTDSGGIQEEAPTLKKPVVVMRNKTERNEGVRKGCTLLAGNSKKGIIKAVTKIIDDPRQYRKMIVPRNPYGDGKSAQRIVKILKDKLSKF